MDNTVFLPDTHRYSIVMKHASQIVGYQITNYNIPEHWSESQGQGITIAILDTGAQTNHQDLVDSFVPGSMRYNFHNMISNRAEYDRLNHIYRTEKNRWKRAKAKSKRDQFAYNVDDGDGHGTHCAGIITANNNNLGIVGVAPMVGIMPLKVLGDNGSGSYEAVTAGILHAVGLGVDVISMSLGGPTTIPPMHDAIKLAHSKGIPVICAAGNNGSLRLDYPGRYPETISIGALTKANLRAEFSQGGKDLNFMAPGVDILSTVPTNDYQVMSGTSMATPWAAAVVALIIAKHRKEGGKTPISGVEDIRDHLRKTAIDLGQAGRDIETGFGLVDVGAAMEHIASNKSSECNIPDNVPDEPQSVEDRLATLEGRMSALEHKE